MSRTGLEARADASAPYWDTRRVMADWAVVRVHLVEVVPDHAGGRVRAVVRLGGIAPADVHVELRPAARPDDAPRAAARPMWSTQSYDNGCYVFEAAVAREEFAVGGDWLVRVRPRAPLPAAAVLHRLRLRAPHVTPS